MFQEHLKVSFWVYGFNSAVMERSSYCHCRKLVFLDHCIGCSQLQLTFEEEGRVDSGSLLYL